MRKQNILVVDDEVSFCQILKAGLGMHGFAVRYEARSTNVIDVCLEFHPDLVVPDIDMPVKDGGHVAAELKNHPKLRRTAVIFLTSLVTKKNGESERFRRNIPCQANSHSGVGGQNSCRIATTKSTMNRHTRSLPLPQIHGLDSFRVFPIPNVMHHLLLALHGITGCGALIIKTMTLKISGIQTLAIIIEK